MLARRAKLEDMYCIGCRGDAEKRRGGVERHAEYPGGHASAPELVEFLGGRDGEYADYGAFVGGRGEEGAGVVEGDMREGRAVRFDDVYGFEFEGVEEEDGA